MKYTFCFSAFCGKKLWFFVSHVEKAGKWGGGRAFSKESISLNEKYMKNQFVIFLIVFQNSKSYVIVINVFLFRNKTQMIAILNLHLVHDRLSSDKIKTNNLNQVNFNGQYNHSLKNRAEIFLQSSDDFIECSKQFCCVFPFKHRIFPCHSLWLKLRLEQNLFQFWEAVSWICVSKLTKNTLQLTYTFLYCAISLIISMLPDRKKGIKLNAYCCNHWVSTNSRCVKKGISVLAYARLSLRALETTRKSIFVSQQFRFLCLNNSKFPEFQQWRKLL